jgi:GNAT superfamily N-acetyltransferase
MFVPEPIDVRAAQDHEYAALGAFADRLRAERQPDDPPIPLAERVAGYRNMPSFGAQDTWVLWAPDRSALLAVATLGRLLTEENAHLAQMGIEVLPEWRRQGLGRRLLAELVGAAEGYEKRLLLGATVDRVPAGEAFMVRLGAAKGMEAHTNQLKMADLDMDLVRRWIEAAAERARDFKLGLWVGPYPEEDLAAIARLHDVMNDAPLGDLEVEDMRFSPEQLRQIEQAVFSRGARRWVMYVREIATGRFAGYTEVVWHPDRPEILQQGDTGVLPEYRGHGLGKWLKAAMLAKVAAELPDVRLVRTGNADSNAAMLRINNDLGFQSYMAQAFWQVETTRVRAYLDEANTAAG